MKRNAKIIQISGFRGLLLLVFTIVCLTAGFVVFPGFCAMFLWNHIAGMYTSIPFINLIQGVLLWAFTALSLYLASGRKVFLSFHKENELADAEIKDIMEKIKTESKTKMINSMILNPEDIQKLKDIKEKAQNQAAAEKVGAGMQASITNETKEEVSTSSEKENL